MVRRRDRVALSERLDALDEALAAAGGRVPDDLLEEARAVRRRAGERRAAGDQAVVVALCGGTGSGKSSLFNALAGRDLAAVDARRPTTSTAASWSVGDPAEVEGLLAWLEIDADQRHHDPPGAGPDGIVLVDLPDIDSVEHANRVTADRLIERVDLLVWVVDPLKYAQRSLHEGYLAKLRAHADVMLVALNQVDRLDAAARDTCREDLERLVGADGRAPRVLATSTATGEGVDALRKVLTREVGDRRAIARRIAADVRAAATRLLDASGAPAGDDRTARDPLDATSLAAALESVAGTGAFADRAHDAYLVAARRAVRSPAVAVALVVVRALGAVLGGLKALGRLTGGARPAAGRAPRPDPAAARLRVQHALLDLVERARHDLPWFWAERVRQTADEADGALPAALKAALAGVPTEPARRRWWGAARAVWWLAEATIAIGVAWLVLAVVLGWLQLPQVPVPMVTEDVAVPGLLVAAGAALWALVAVVRRVAVRAAARRHRRRVARLAARAVHEAVETTALAPLQRELDAYGRFRAALATAAT